jgi:aryl-alcohol dehydrogenase-like predicted oxidoreductase
MNQPKHLPGWGTGTIASLGRKLPSEALAGFHRLFSEERITIIDTADSYGSGDAERLLARVLPNHNPNLQIITKAGYRYSNLPPLLGPWNQISKKFVQRILGRKHFAPAYLQNCLERSLQRLGRSAVDGFLLHDPPITIVRDSAIWNKLIELRKAGLTKKIGLSSSDSQVIEAALRHGPVDLVQTPANLVKAGELRAVWQICFHRGIQLIGNHIFPPTLVRDRNIPHKELARASAALLPPGSILLCGTHNPAHLEEFARWIALPCTKDELGRCFQRAGLPLKEFDYV